MTVRSLRAPWAGRAPLRRKIAALAAATALLVVAAVGVLVHLWTAQDIRSRGEARAMNTLYAAMDVYRRTGVLTDGAELDPDDLPAALGAPADGERHHVYDGQADGNVGPSVWAAQRTGGRGSPVLAVQINLSPDRANLSRLDAAMALASLVALAGAVPLAVYGAGFLSRRLGRVAETAARISAGDLDARSGPTKGRDEVADIAATVDRMADSLALRLRTERRFTADVAHELRTPVGGLLAAVDLLPHGETEDLLRARVRDLRDLVEDLLEISRLDSRRRGSGPRPGAARCRGRRGGLPYRSRRRGHRGRRGRRRRRRADGGDRPAPPGADRGQPRRQRAPPRCRPGPGHRRRTDGRRP